jgi:hypothetical protein
MVALDLQLPALLSPGRQGARQDHSRRTLKAGAEAESLGIPDRMASGGLVCLRQFWQLMPEEAWG